MTRREEKKMYTYCLQTHRQTNRSVHVIESDRKKKEEKGKRVIELNLVLMIFVLVTQLMKLKHYLLNY